MLNSESCTTARERNRKRRGGRKQSELGVKRTKGQLRVATKVVLHIIVLVFVLAKSPQSSCCQPKSQLCGCVCVCESLLDLMMHATDANHQFTQLNSASASASASASGWASTLLVYLGPVQAASAVAVAATAAAAVNWPMAFCLQNISETLPGLFPVGISISVVCVLLSFGRLFIIVVPLW